MSKKRNKDDDTPPILRFPEPDSPEPPDPDGEPPDPTPIKGKPARPTSTKGKRKPKGPPRNGVHRASPRTPPKATAKGTGKTNRNGGKPIVQLVQEDWVGVGEDLTPLQMRFVQEYIVDLNGVGAYKRAGYTVSNDNVAGVEAHRLLTNPKIEAAIREAFKRAKVSKDIRIDRELILRRLREEGDYVDAKDTGASQAARIKAWQELGKLHGFYPDKPAATPNTTVNVGVLVGQDGHSLARTQGDTRTLTVADMPTDMLAGIIDYMEAHGYAALDLDTLARSTPKQLPAPPVTIDSDTLAHQGDAATQSSEAVDTLARPPYGLKELPDDEDE